ncbi:MAG: hypothetical protein Tsb002_08350 [Wenzhouxiangellaceae bacterium]
MPMITLIMLMPVIVFLMWLYWISRPEQLPPNFRMVDLMIMISAPITSLAFAAVVFYLMPQVDMWAHILAALVGYLALVTELGAGWVIRHLAVKRQSKR